MPRLLGLACSALLVTGCSAGPGKLATSAPALQDEAPVVCEHVLTGRGYQGWRLVDQQSSGFRATLCSIVEPGSPSADSPRTLLGLVVQDGRPRLLEVRSSTITSPVAGGDPGPAGPVLR